MECGFGTNWNGGFSGKWNTSRDFELYAWACKCNRMENEMNCRCLCLGVNLGHKSNFEIFLAYD